MAVGRHASRAEADLDLTLDDLNRDGPAVNTRHATELEHKHD